MAEARSAVSVHVGRLQFLRPNADQIEVRFNVPTPRAALRGCKRRATRVKRAAENAIYPANAWLLTAVAGSLRDAVPPRALCVRVCLCVCVRVCVCVCECVCVCVCVV